jgi:hypothetical protein
MNAADRLFAYLDASPHTAVARALQEAGIAADANTTGGSVLALVVDAPGAPDILAFSNDDMEWIVGRYPRLSGAGMWDAFYSNDGTIVDAPDAPAYDAPVTSVLAWVRAIIAREASGAS